MEKESDTLCASYASLQITVENRDYHQLSDFPRGIDEGRQSANRLQALEVVSVLAI
jgi:hypothetical protein